ncbi:MAG: tRNA uridine-5-carboxymethylaminomethyl(34) synthesis GTPase MnmE [Bacillota bacterium]|nr:tRNA uridine-5-carboxymethylaminomethyl(34) synthesis GTPase MnmE [Bacillota bacterium]
MTDTIAAISGAAGDSAIGIVRLSGPTAKSIVDRIFVHRALAPREMTYGFVVDPKTATKIDEVMAVFLPAPATYTREDVVEIYCHGGNISVHRILRILLAEGARLAEPGEFTLRAFLNGRIDLVQAESVIDLVKARTTRSFDSALTQLEGSLSRGIRELRGRLVWLITEIAVSIDYPEEDVEDVSMDRIRTTVQAAIDELDQLIRRSASGKLLRDGAKVAIVGKPNVGKSSLMNLLLGESRAIVTDIAGTTRDTIEEQLSIEGVPIRLIDTAGIRDASDEVERIGIERAKKAANEADIIVLVLDLSSELTEEEAMLIEHFSDRPTLVLLNKSDLPRKMNTDRLHELYPSDRILETSIKNAEAESYANSVRKLSDVLGTTNLSSDAVTNTRHLALLQKANRSLHDALQQDTYDLIEIDLRAAIEHLGEITGESASEDIIRSIFSNFCLGK